MATGWGSEAWGDDRWGGGTALASTAPPVFAGVQAIEQFGQAAIYLTWNPATDAVTPPDQIIYLVYRTTTGTFDFSSPIGTTLPGQLSYLDRVSVLNNVPYSYVVRAQNLAGLTDTNTKTLTILIPPASDQQQLLRQAGFFDLTRYRKTYSYVRQQPRYVRVMPT